jgi:hypothetical protein
MQSEKEQRLLRLKHSIETTIPDAWLFPVDPDFPHVRSFLGTGALMCVAERPSMGRVFPDATVRRLYRLLDELGLGDSHLTDLIKSRGKVTDPYPTDLGPHKAVFDAELDIVRLRGIIALGQHVFQMLRFTLADTSIKILSAHLRVRPLWPARGHGIQPHVS